MATEVAPVVQVLECRTSKTLVLRTQDRLIERSRAWARHRDAGQDDVKGRRRACRSAGMRTPRPSSCRLCELRRAEDRRRRRLTGSVRFVRRPDDTARVSVQSEVASLDGRRHVERNLGAVALRAARRTVAARLVIRLPRAVAVIRRAAVTPEKWADPRHLERKEQHERAGGQEHHGAWAHSPTLRRSSAERAHRRSLARLALRASADERRRKPARHGGPLASSPALTSARPRWAPSPVAFCPADRG